MGLKDILIGDYDWWFLCTPRAPCSGATAPPPFFRKDDQLSIFVAFVMGLQHALAMVGGIITVPLILSGRFYGAFTDDERQYVIAASLIVSGIASLIQVTQIPIPFTNYVIGSGLLSVMGVSFTFLPIAQTTITTLRQCTCDGVSCTVGGDCDLCTGTLSGSCVSGQDAFGKILGTCCVAALLEVGFSFLPPKVLRRIFPPVVTGCTVILIGFALVGSGFKSWGGGVFCADQVLTAKIPCDANGEVILPFGSKQYVGLGFAVFSTLFVTEMFGSPFLRNISVVMGLLVGMVVASATGLTQCTENCVDPVCPCFDVLPAGVSYDNVTNAITGTPNGTAFGASSVCLTDCGPPVCSEPTCRRNRYVTSRQISSADWVTFLWVEQFKLGFYAPVLLPLLFGFMVSTMECIGDVTATTEASGLIPIGENYERSVRGAILSDGLNCIWGGLAFVLPVVTYSGNNGIIALTRCAARRAGWACAIILIILGVFAKFAGVILTIPDAVLGGMTTFLFINVSISGMKILTMGDGINRRNRFIAAMALAMGVGVSLVPEWVNIFGQFDFPFEGHLWRIRPSFSDAFRGFRDALIIVLSTGFSIGGFIALILNLVLPYDLPEVEEAEHDTAYSTGTAEREGLKGGEMSKPNVQHMDKDVL